MAQAIIYDVIIIGSGPSGLTAAIYLGRARRKVLLFTGLSFGGQLMKTTLVENFPGFAEGILGPKLMIAMRTQAQKFGTEIIDNEVSKVDFSKQPCIIFEGEKKYQTRSVLIATGAEPIMLGLANEKQWYGRGLSTCAVCDAAFYKDKITYVVGGGDSAVEDTVALTKYAAKVFMVVRRDELRASQIMQEKVKTHPKVTILWHSEVTAIRGSNNIEGLEITDNKSGNKTSVPADGLFYAIGHKPQSKLFAGQLELDQAGYITTQLTQAKSGSAHDVWLDKYPSMTSKAGIFAAGDVVDFRYRQAVTAAAYGTMAALDIDKWLNHQVIK